MKQYAITLKGKSKTWTFHLADVDGKYLTEWRADGLRIDEVLSEPKKKEFIHVVHRSHNLRTLEPMVFSAKK